MKLTELDTMVRVLLAVVALQLTQGCTRFACCDMEVRLMSWKMVIWEFFVEKGSLPATLDAGAKHCHWDNPIIDDCFGERIVYRPMWPTFELHSMGRDRKPRTEDDILLGDRWGSCELGWAGTEWVTEWKKESLDPRDAVAFDIDRLVGFISREREFRGWYPQSLDGLLWSNGPDIGIGAPTEPVDAWGMPYRYSASEAGFVLFSAGPDGRPGTDDDIYPGGGTGRCKE